MSSSSGSNNVRLQNTTKRRTGGKGTNNIPSSISCRMLGSSNDSGGESDGMNSDSDGNSHRRRSSSMLIDAMNISSNGRSNNSNSNNVYAHRINNNNASNLRQSSSFRNWRAMEHDDDDDTGSSSDSSNDGGVSSDTFSLAVQQRRRRRLANLKGYLTRKNGTINNDNTTSGASSDNDQGRPPLVPGSNPGTPKSSKKWTGFAGSFLGQSSTSSMPPQPDTPRALLVTQLRKSSLSSDVPMTPGDAQGGRSMNRIASLLREESAPFEKEIAHERVTTSLFRNIPPLKLPSVTANNLSGSSNFDDSGIINNSIKGGNPLRSNPANGPDSPESIASMHSLTSSQMYLDELSDATLPQAVRASPIPNSQLRSPATYISNSSRLNPESQFISSKHQDMIISSPLMSPAVNAVIGHMSPIAMERRNKRKLSLDERFEPYKRHHRVPSSPSGNAPSSRSLSPGAPMLPSPTLSQQLFPPLRSRSPSVSVLPGSNVSPDVMNAMGIMIQGGASNNVIGLGPGGLALFSGTSLSTLLNGGNCLHGMSVPSSVTPIETGNHISNSHQGNIHSNTTPFLVGSPKVYSQSPLVESITNALPSTGMTIVNSSQPLSPRAIAPFGQMLNLSGAQGEFSKMSITTTEMADR